MKFTEWLEKYNITKVTQLQRITGFNYYICYNLMRKNNPTLVKKQIEHLHKITHGELDGNSFLDLREQQK